MSRIVASLLTAAAVLPAFWFNVNPDGARFCTMENGTLVPYTVDRLNDVNETVTLSFGGASQALWCSNVAEVPVR